jgi:23S rRNA pseudouridine2605 synthase
LTSEQLEVSRAERMRQDGHGALTLEDARIWIEETGLCLFLPRRQFSSSIAPSFVEAVAGRQTATPDPRQVAIAEELLVRLESDNVAVRLNLLGQPGDQPDFVVAGWVLPYVYALRGDRDWRRSPQLTGSRAVSPLAIQAYKQLELGDATLAELRHALGREVSEAAVLRAITELWQQLRIIPVLSAPGKPAKWQLLRIRFQKAIAEGASTSQVTAISVLASIYLQAVIAASMEEVELFLAPLTARSKIREVLRGLVATRQVHTISLGHAPHFYVAGTLPEFAAPATTYTSAALPAYFSHTRSWEDEASEPEPKRSAPPAPPIPAPAPLLNEPRNGAAVESLTPQAPINRKPAPKPSNARPRFARSANRSRDRKPVSVARRRTHRAGSSISRPAGGHAPRGSKSATRASWSSKPSATTSNGTHKAGHRNGNGLHSNGNGRRVANRAPAGRNAKPPASSLGRRNGHANGAKPVSRNGGKGVVLRNSAGSRADSRPNRGKKAKPALTASAKAGNSKRYGFTARPGRENAKSVHRQSGTKRR